jgi:hypothetical protein
MNDDQQAAFDAVVVRIEAAHDNIGTSWLWEWNLPALFHALIDFYADAEDDPQGWVSREKAAAMAARAAVGGVPVSAEDGEK